MPVSKHFPSNPFLLTISTSDVGMSPWKLKLDMAPLSTFPKSEGSMEATPIQEYVDEQPLTPQKEEQNLSIRDMELANIEKALQKYHGNRKKAAKELGISDRTLYRKIKQFGIDN